jgi:hypothetical protein
MKRPPAPPPRATFGEAAARRLLLVRACETAPVPEALWSAADANWATRLAGETAGRHAAPARWLDERACHAAERLRQRDRKFAAWLRQRGGTAGRAGVLAAVVLGAGLLGLFADGLGGRRQIDLLAPPMLAVLAWNLVVYALLAVQGLRVLWGLRGLQGLRTSSTGAGGAPARPDPRRAGQRLIRRLVQRLTQGPALEGVLGRAEPGSGFEAEWAQRTLPLHAARAALLMHLAAAALAGGIVAGLYLRGLVLDFRAGWQSTFLGADAVHALLATLLAPAAAVTGIVVPDVAAIGALRVEPGHGPLASAAPWIHLFGATLGLAVIAPRMLLAAGAGVQAWRRARHIELALDEPYFQRLLAEAGRGLARVQVLPHGAPPSAQAALGLRALLARVFGEGVELRMAAATPYGNEDQPPPPEPGATLQLMLCDLAATPEPEVHGHLFEMLRSRPGLVLVVADTSAWRARFAALPQRVAEREAAWRAFAKAHGVRLLAVALDAVDRAEDPAGAAGLAGAAAALDALLREPPEASS